MGEAEREIACLVNELVEGGLSEMEAKEIASQLYAGQKREGNFPLKINLSSWYKIVDKYMKEGKIGFGRMVKSAVQLFLGLTNVPDGSRNPYKDIENGATDIFLTGFWGVPKEISFFEKHSGKKMVYLNTTDPDVVQHYARLIMYKNGGLPDVFAFSDGAKTAKLYGDKYNFSHVNHVYAVGAKAIEYSPSKKGTSKYTHPKVTYVCESQPLITALEDNYSSIFNVPRVEFTGDHLSPFYERKAAREIGDIMNKGPKRANFNRSTLVTSGEINSVNRVFDTAKYKSFDFRKAA